MIFQAGGWSGLPAAESNGTADPTWALNWGKNGYLLKSSSVYLTQMGQIQGLSKTTAIAVLLMPAVEANASGYGACWGGAWVSGSTCSGGSGWKTPDQMFADVKWAAWMKGIQVAPLVSINNYERLSDANRGQAVLTKLQDMVSWLRTMTDATTLKTVEGKIVVLTEGLPGNTGMSDAQKQAVLSWMGAQTDILWIDNLAAMDNAPANMLQYPNIYRSAASGVPYPPPSPLTSDYDAQGNWCPSFGVQDSLKSSYGSRYRWHFSDRYGKREAEMSNANYKACEAVRLRFLNITPYEAARYPVVISQWNEYGEFLNFEPSLFDGYNEYNYLNWRLSQQP
ncbi:hypothetical protein E4K72_05545 [Oxalobacteraceae bacterium OM1]|nr:hypothetical protein E4K72_05545 [Oxalobacteraceae bacterium OM1]